MSNPLTLREGGVADIDAVAELHARSWRKTYRGLFSDAFLDGPVFAERRDLWTRRLRGWDRERNAVLLAESQGALAGFAAIMLDTEPEWGARLDNLHVDPDGQGRGVGRLLMQAAGRWTVGKAPRLHLMVFDGNAAARGFYDEMQGECVERRDVTVEDGTRLVELRYLWRDLKVLTNTRR
ncbi:MAG: GNAT family N-acetyltransferase [Betaproteobacteria bacterium]|nr:GNAT family N-acetyltransferase [Betaproteobacteria bacterium]